MKATGHIYLVKSSRPPTVEIDTEVKAAYVRFSTNKIAETREVAAQERCMVAVDLDGKGQVLGVELIGISSFEIKCLLKLVPISVTRPEILERTRYISANEAHRQR